MFEHHCSPLQDQRLLSNHLDFDSFRSHPQQSALGIVIPNSPKAREGAFTSAYGARAVVRTNPRSFTTDCSCHTAAPARRTYRSLSRLSASSR